jgi:hypothetical protein
MSYLLLLSLNVLLAWLYVGAIVCFLWFLVADGWSKKKCRLDCCGS